MNKRKIIMIELDTQESTRKVQRTFQHLDGVGRVRQVTVIDANVDDPGEPWQH